jgi:hypothetical protein
MSYRQRRAAGQLDDNRYAMTTDNETTVNESPLAPPTVPWAAVVTGRDTKLAVDQPSLLFASYDNLDIASVGKELDELLVVLIELLGGKILHQLDRDPN